MVEHIILTFWLSKSIDSVGNALRDIDWVMQFCSKFIILTYTSIEINWIELNWICFLSRIEITASIWSWTWYGTHKKFFWKFVIIMPKPILLHLLNRYGKVRKPVQTKSQITCVCGFFFFFFFSTFLWSKYLRHICIWEGEKKKNQFK